MWYNIENFSSRITNLDLTHIKKTMYEKCQHRIIYQHMNATCQM